ncbi:MAG: hypothetical protein AYK22_05850 [Thermoplasmatales archaeon SG8-52-3]|nr:MAG: hypothetical protein AYK22_05850 [Thermoplasmatales archaeon SG8-52-3]
MREYRIKKGHNQDISALIENHFGTKGDIFKGINFEVEGIGKVDMKQEKNFLIVDIEPPKKVYSDPNLIKKWNEFLFEATGMTSKERKKEFGKIKK